jgi:hypothetical protein
MKKFIDWLIENNYGYLKHNILYLNFNNTYSIPVNNSGSNRMMIGYMIEYLSLKGRFIGLESITSKNRSWETIDSYYNHLMTCIENL